MADVVSTMASTTVSHVGPSASGRTRWLLFAVSALLTVAPLVVFLTGDRTTREIVLATAAAGAAAYAAAVHPRLVFAGWAVVLGVVPYMHVPGTSVPLLLVLSLGLWGALLFVPGVAFRPAGLELAVVVLGSLALLSVVASDLSPRALVEYAAWLVATAVVIPIRFLPDDVRSAVVRSFTVATAVGAVVGVLIRMDALGPLLGHLSVVGYDPERNVQFVFGDESNTARLSGTFLEPNIAGLILAVGVLLAVAYFRSMARVVLVLVISGGLLLTLSRASIATVAVAALVVVLRSPARRLAVVTAGVAAGVVALAIPIVRERLLGSFGPSDFGSVARELALKEFPGSMEGHWWWGLGWDRPEFRDRDIGQVVNYVANVPLVTVYRGGIVLGLVAVALLVLLVLRSWLHAARSFESAVLCGGVIGFVLVALQLDFPVALQAPATAVFSFLVALSLTASPPRPHRSADA